MFLPLLDLSNNASLVIELVFGIIIGVIISSIFFWRERKLSENQEKIVRRIEELTSEQSRLLKNMDEIRKSRIRWFKTDTIMLLRRVKDEYEKLAKALDDYASNGTDENSKQIISIANNALLGWVSFTQYNIKNHLIPDANQFIEKTWVISELPSKIANIGLGFTRALDIPIDVDGIREISNLCVEIIDASIDEINKVRED